MTHPKSIGTVHVEPVGDELCVYDWQAMQVHTLNPTAAQVWQRCDGQTSPAQIAAQLHAVLGVPHAEALVQLSLRELAAANLLEQPTPLGLRHTPISRRQLLKLGVVAATLPAVGSIAAPAAVFAQTPLPTAVQPTTTPTAVQPTATPQPTV